MAREPRDVRATSQDVRIELLSAGDTPEDVHKLIQLLDERTDWGPDATERHLLYSGPAAWHVLVWVGPELTVKVAIIDRQILLGKETVRVAGIGGVTTAPPFQGQGFATRALAEAIQFIQSKLDVPFALLTCMDHRKQFYEQRGWKTVSEPVLCSQPDGQLQLNVPGQWVMARPFRGQHPNAPIDLQGPPF